MKKIALLLFIFLATTGLASAKDVYVTTMSNDNASMQIYIDDSSIAHFNKTYTFSYAVVSNTTGESARFTGSIASFFTPYDVFYVNGQPTYVSELTPEGQAMIRAFLSYLESHQPTLSY